MRISSLIALAAMPLLCMCSSKAPAPPPQVIQGQTPDSFRVAFETTKGRFVVQAYRGWAPRGAERFRDLLEAGFFDNEKFFRVVPGFMAQFGLASEARWNQPWDSKPIPDDSVKGTNARGVVSFATMGPNTRTHQLFINLVDNPRLDAMGFAPIGRVIEGMSVVDSLYNGYGEDPNQGFIQSLGNVYLERSYPKLDGIKTARILAP
ncbi:MAG: peptidylprolyl isomerase [Gemmatimonadaceae bacterium]